MRRIFFLALVCLFPFFLQADTIDLSAFGQSDQPMVLGDYLNGGFGEGSSGPIGPGPNLGIQAINNLTDGAWVWGIGGHDYLGFGLHLERTLLFNNGITGLFSFQYAGSGQDNFPSYTGQINALDATGKLVGSITFTDDGLLTSGFHPASFQIDGIATQLVFGANGSDAGAFWYDALTFNPAAATDPPSSAPEPSALAAVGLLLMLGVRLSRRLCKSA